jgi:hypothetical protein
MFHNLRTIGPRNSYRPRPSTNATESSHNNKIQIQSRMDPTSIYLRRLIAVVAFSAIHYDLQVQGDWHSYRPSKIHPMASRIKTHMHPIPDHIRDPSASARACACAGAHAPQTFRCQWTNYPSASPMKIWLTWKHAKGELNGKLTTSSKQARCKLEAN